MAVAGGYDSDSRREVQEKIAVNVFNNCPTPTLGHKWITAGVRRRDELVIKIENAGGLWSRQGGLNAGKLRFGNGRHPTSREKSKNLQKAAHLRFQRMPPSR